MRTCKNCKCKFEPQYNTVQQTCSFECAIELSQKNKEKKDKKVWRKEKKRIKESLKTNADYVRELQVVFNKFIRLRDKTKGCISCGKPLNTKFDAGHFYSTGSYPELRFNEYNVHGQCVHCNQHKRGNLIEYSLKLPDRIGKIKVHELRKLAHKPRRYTIDELKGLKVMYKLKIKQLEK